MFEITIKIYNVAPTCEIKLKQTSFASPTTSRPQISNSPLSLLNHMMHTEVTNASKSSQVNSHYSSSRICAARQRPSSHNVCGLFLLSSFGVEDWMAAFLHPLNSALHSFCCTYVWKKHASTAWRRDLPILRANCDLERIRLLSTPLIPLTRSSPQWRSGR